MTSKESIFISYCRSDSQDVVGRMDDHLSSRFGREHVFLDRNSIDYGDAFPNRLKQAIQNSKVVLVVIGPTWLSVQDQQGRPRLASADDWVRQEIALALEQGLYVIPVLLDGTVMPSPEQLPPDIQALATRNAIDVSAKRSTNLFTAGMKEIIDSIEKAVPALRPDPPITLEVFEFEVKTLQIQSGLFGKKVSLQTQKKRAQQYIERRLGHNTFFDMVLIPGGTFMMGAPASEEESSSDERPQHQVTVPAFLMSKNLVTQDLWRWVASLPRVEQEIELNPSEFKGDRRPVEQVNWYEAVEFCARLSQQTGRRYRLPSESEWEYACRAETMAPFHFGETLTTGLANYRGIDFDLLGMRMSGSYGDAPKGVYRKQTTDVGSFPPNAFGLYDMHGNGYEWCADYWHDNYQGAPTDGSAWVKGGSSEKRVLRGGYWDDNPGQCRSASRNYSTPDYRSSDVGFRVVCAAPGTPWPSNPFTL